VIKYNKVHHFVQHSDRRSSRTQQHQNTPRANWGKEPLGVSVTDKSENTLVITRKLDQRWMEHFQHEVIYAYNSTASINCLMHRNYNAHTAPNTETIETASAAVKNETAVRTGSRLG